MTDVKTEAYSINKCADAISTQRPTLKTAAHSKRSFRAVADEAEGSQAKCSVAPLQAWISSDEKLRLQFDPPTEAPAFEGARRWSAVRSA
jgi:hypothetical protein